VTLQQTPIRVLLVEDSQAEAEIVIDQLTFARVPGFAVEHATRLSEALDALRRAPAQVVVLDLGLPDAQGLEGVTAVHEAAPSAAIVVRSGLSDERMAIAALAAGAQDYVLKAQRIADEQLERAIQFAFARHQAEEAARRLRQAEDRFRAAFEHAPIGVAIVGLRGPEKGQFIRTNDALGEIVGAAAGRLTGTLLTSLVFAEDSDKTIDAILRLERGETVQWETRFVHSDGGPVWVLVSATPVPDVDGGEAQYCVSQVLDISERKRFEGQLQYLADHDALTGLFNRRRFEADIERIVTEAARYTRAGALLILDVDGFKYVNDRFGHSAGDELVQRIASLLRSSVRDSDLVARLGGDEFAVVLQECSEHDATQVAIKMLEVIRRHGFVQEENHRIRVTTSIGITTFSGDCGLTGAELVVEADIAMYDAKAAGRDRYSVYNRAANRRKLLSERHSWLERMRSALENDGFVLHAQPIVGFRTNGVDRYELLLRMLDERGDLIPPGAFLYNAERFDLMGEIDRWVLRKAITLLHDYTAAGHEVSFSVNLSGKTMNDLRIRDDLAEMLEQHPIASGRLIVEVTETAAIVNIERARDLAREIRKLGCLFALDDFGAGFASFYYLKHLDFDYLKIDGEFVKHLLDSVSDQLIVKAIVEIARGLGTLTIAEFVGDEETADLLHTLGVDFGQGFHLARPAPVTDFLGSRPAQRLSIVQGPRQAP
jgi:diguanylate cyclase (GGDEF)-like protein/PAS domain S-box-containing protein